MKTICDNQAKRHFANFVQCHQHRIIESWSTQRFWATDRQQQVCDAFGCSGPHSRYIERRSESSWVLESGETRPCKGARRMGHTLNTPARSRPFRAIRTVGRHGLGPLGVPPERSNRYLKERQSWLLNLGKKEASSSLPLINLHNANAKLWILMAQSCDPQIPRETLALKEGIPCIHCPVLSVHVPMKWVNELTMWPASPQGGRGGPMHWRKYTLYSVPRSPRTIESQWSLYCYADETTEC